MATKGTAGRSASGASMSRYDVEVEGRLKALEAKAHEKCDGGGAKLNAAGLPPLASRKDEAYKRLDALEARLEALIAALS
jgi:hypothetical protein|tara:strand:+ start:2261 stop:2500 length:240 start_codon:yes stop_codon:yes gene_type:complete